MSENRFITFNKKQIYVRSMGRGTVVLLVHGFGEDGTIWDNQAQFLKNDFKLIIPDLPGCGKSESATDVSMESIADMLKAVLDAAGAESCHLIGHSMGGYISLAFAEKYGTRLISLGLFHSSSFADIDEKKEVRKKGIQFIQTHGAACFLKTVIPNLFSPESPEQSDGLIRNFIETLPDFSSDVLISYYEAMMKRPDRSKLISALEIPVLLVAGQFDHAVPVTDSLKQAHLPEKCYFHILKKSGHMGMIEEPHQSNWILKSFLLKKALSSSTY